VPKVNKIADNLYQYKCRCGRLVTLETDIKPDRLSLCWECLEKIDGNEKNYLTDYQ